MKIFALFFASFVFALASCSKSGKEADSAKVAPSDSAGKITFVELGSTTCVPCKQMKEVMKKIEEKFGDQLNLVFIDVMKDKEKSREYKVVMIPTQVFLDSAGVEFHRHEGYYPEEEITKLLETKGLKRKGV